MSDIRILPDDVSNRIAAGEVIERPASIVKELTENSLDAGAVNIRVAVEKAGRKLVSVTDDGRGMDPDDALLCLEPHATSKIASIGDMDMIATMGFRGEAMPSIASVSRMTIQTKTENAIEGTEVVVEGGRLIASAPVGCAKGTRVAVKDLFFNTPARRKFLRTDTTEEKHILDVVTMLALSRPDVGFELALGGTSVLSVRPGGGLPARVQALFGKRISANMIPLSHRHAEIEITGFIAKHGFTKKSRKEQRVFINRRPVEAPAIYRGIRNGYESLVMRGDFPPVVLFIDMDPGRVDINVHPAKREVRFKEDFLVARTVADAIRETLRTSATPTVSVSPNLSMDAIVGGAEVDYAPPIKNQPGFEGFDASSGVLPDIKPEIALPPPSSAFHSPSQSADSAEPPSCSGAASSDPSGAAAEVAPPALEILAFLDDTYILAQSDDGLVVIDQHAAHERVLFEQLMAGSGDVQPPVQRLLIPVTLEVSRAEARFVERHASEFRGLGFEIESFGRNTLIVRSLPAAVETGNAGKLISDILDSLLAGETKPKGIDKAVIAKNACSMAVKANDKLTIEEAKALLAEMAGCQLPYSCPHGRPTMINISKSELEKRFGRR
jgi:DNA mismatch repair protein MutL